MPARPEGVYADGKGGWYFKATLGRDPLTGKRSQVTRRGFRTAADAGRARQVLLSGDRRIPRPSVVGMTLDELLDLYLDGLDADERLSVKTRFDYRKNAEAYVRPLLGDRRVPTCTATSHRPCSARRPTVSAPRCSAATTGLRPASNAIRPLMRLPSESLLRPGPPPDDLLMVVRGGTRTLSDAHLTNQVGDCWESHQFFGVSVFGAPDDDLVALSGAVRAIRIRPVVRVARCGALRSGGFEVMPTFPNPFHYSVVLPDASPSTFELLRRCFGAPEPNPGHEPER